MYGNPSRRRGRLVITASSEQTSSRETTDVVQTFRSAKSSRPEGPHYDDRGRPEGLHYDDRGRPEGPHYDDHGRPKGLHYGLQCPVMKSLLPESDRILLGPGPSMTSPRVMRAMAAP